VFIVGDADYYERFGFSREAAGPFEANGQADLLAIELTPKALAGAAGSLVHPAALRP
jgi:predicted N-acetyltransferase YhbS